MMLHTSPRPFRNLGPPTRFATARDIAIFALCLLLVIGFLLQVLGGPRAALEPVPRSPVTEGGAPT